ncbi:MAG: PEGA domain-containing protein [Myxococcales bacterium]
MKLALALAILGGSACGGQVILRSNPTGAEVLIDGSPAGYTPMALDQEHGLGSRHLVTLYREGYAPLTEEIAASRPDFPRFFVGSLFAWPLLFSSADYPDEYDFVLTRAAPAGSRSQ